MKLKKNGNILFRYIKVQRLSLIALSILLFLKVGLQIYNPTYISKFIDSAKQGTEFRALINIAITFLVLTFVEQTFIVIVRYLSNIIGWNATNELRLDLTKHCLNLDVQFYNEHTPAEIVQRIDGDVILLNNFFSMFALQIVSNGILLCGIVAVIFSIKPMVGIVVLILAIISIVILIKVRNFAKNSIVEYQKINANLIGFIDERIKGKEDIKPNGAEHYIYNEFNKIFKTLYKKRKETGVRVATTTNIGELVVGVIIAIVVGVLGIVYLNDKGISAGKIFLIYYYITILIIPLKNIVFQLGDLQNINATIDRVNELFNTLPRVSQDGENAIDSDYAEIEIKNLTFSYDESEKGSNVLNDINLKILPRKCVGIVGKTGSGKTTLISLLVRAYEYYEGNILINGIDIKTIKLEELRKNIGVVSQRIELFNGTLRDNITLYNKDIKDEDILKVIKELEMCEWLKLMPNGLDSKIEEDGKNMSSGEAQIVTLIRVFLKKCKIIILDEATAKLDVIAEKIIDRAVEKLIKNKTSIIIAHKLETLKKVDYIITIKDGMIIDSREKSNLDEVNIMKYSSLLEGGV